MAKLKSLILAHEVEQVIAARVAAGEPLCVGLSGGVDSVVLLDILAECAPRHAWRLSALHVNHQLSPHASAWARFCRQFCRERGVPLRVVKVTVPRGFTRLRSYGFLANTHKKTKLAAIRAILKVDAPAPPAEDDDDDEPRCCPICGIGALLAHRLVAPIPVRGVDTS